MMTIQRGLRRSNSRIQGFTLIESLTSMFVLMIGLVTLAGVVGMAMSTTQTARQDMIAKQLANEVMESIFAARDSSQSQWTDINNVSNGGVFMDGFQAINLSGADGIVGTADDGPAQVLHEPGPDGNIGTADDVNVSLTTFQRSIAVVPVVLNGNPSATLRQVNVTIRYTTPQTVAPKTYVMSGYISQYH
jgi:type II secretory pathway pseudopilin PulG